MSCPVELKVSLMTLEPGIRTSKTQIICAPRMASQNLELAPCLLLEQMRV